MHLYTVISRALRMFIEKGKQIDKSNIYSTAMCAYVICNFLKKYCTLYPVIQGVSNTFFKFQGFCCYNVAQFTITNKHVNYLKKFICSYGEKLIKFKEKLVKLLQLDHQLYSPHNIFSEQPFNSRIHFRLYQMEEKRVSTCHMKHFYYRGKSQTHQLCLKWKFSTNTYKRSQEACQYNLCSSTEKKS